MYDGLLLIYCLALSDQCINTGRDDDVLRQVLIGWLVSVMPPGATLVLELICTV